ncbi:hypothetical protein [Planomicrobium okeanokoites]|uniref:hypothetical protein n=1 Tax=Planomicrobium okeanokoites TaxID=244 RepID=UPI00356654FF
MNSFTAILEGNDTGGSNPAMVIPVFILPFFFYFLYGTTELSMRFAERYKNRNVRLGSVVISAATAFGIAVYTFARAQALRNEIVLKLDHIENASQMPLLNLYSNSIFFNLMNFILIILLCYTAGVLWSISRKRRQSAENKRSDQVVT